MSKILDLKTAAKMLENGEIVAFPTEMVYGLGALASNSKAINQVFEIKNRPKDNPLICHFYSIDQIKKFAKVNQLSQILLQHFSPGPISLLLPLVDQTLLPATCGNPKIVCRIPNHLLTLELLTKIKIPLVGPSSNTSGFFSPTNAQMVLADIGSKISGVLDGGNCQIGLESTILEVTGHKIEILRNGIIGKIEIEKYLQKIGQNYELVQNELVQKIQKNSNNSQAKQTKSTKLVKSIELESEQNSQNSEQKNEQNLLINPKKLPKIQNLKIAKKIEKVENPVIPGQKYAHYQPKTPFFIVKSFLQITKIIEEKLKKPTQKLEKLEKLEKLSKINKQNLELDLRTGLQMNFEKIVIITTQSQFKKLNLIYPNLQNQIEILNLDFQLQLT